MNKVVLMKTTAGSCLFVPILFAVCCLIVLPISGCMVGPDYHAPRPGAPSGWAGVIAGARGATFSADGAAGRTDTMVETVR